MGVAFRAPRAPIERPKPPSSRFLFYRRRESLEKYTECIRFERDYDLAISLSTLRRIRNKRLRIRNEVRKARVKLAK